MVTVLELSSIGCRSIHPRVLPTDLTCRLAVAYLGVVHLFPDEAIHGVLFLRSWLPFFRPLMSFVLL